MESPRTSLWSRLVFYYSNHKPDQLKPEVTDGFSFDRAILQGNSVVNRCFAREPPKVHHLGTSGARTCIYAGRQCHAIDAVHSKQLGLFSINDVEDLSNSRSN